MRLIYIITNSINGKVYVGQTKDAKMRWRAHQNSRRSKKNFHLKNAFNTHGIENFSFRIIEECDDNLVDERECYWIEIFDSANPEKGYNKYRGKLVHQCHTDESKQKIALAMKNRYFSPEHRQKLSVASLGRKHTELSKQKISLSKKGKIPRGLVEIQSKRWSGEGNPRAGTTYKIAMEIRNYHSSHLNESISSVARRFDVSYKIAYNIVKGISYRS